MNQQANTYTKITIRINQFKGCFPQPNFSHRGQKVRVSKSQNCIKYKNFHQKDNNMEMAAYFFLSLWTNLSSKKLNILAAIVPPFLSAKNNRLQQRHKQKFALN